MPEPIIKKASLREQVVEAVKRDLQEGVISPGERVTEDALVQRLNVSRTPIREALSQLAHLGLLQQRTGGGYVVRSEEHTSELQSLMRISYAVFCLQKKTLKLP